VYLTSTSTETEANFSIAWGTTQVKNSSHHTTRKLQNAAIPNVIQGKSFKFP